MYMKDGSSLKSALQARRSKSQAPDMGDMSEDQDQAKPGEAMSDLAPLPDHADQDQKDDGDGDDDQAVKMGPDGASPTDPVIGIQKSPDKTTISIDIPLMDSKMGEPDMDDMHDEMTSGMTDPDKTSLMGREPKSLMEAARKAALMSRSKKM